MSKNKFYIFGFILLIVSYSFSCYLEYSFVRNVSSSLLTTWIIWIVWNNWCWKFFAGKFRIPLFLSGNWKGKLDSNFDGRTQKGVDVVIKQSFSTVSIEIKTDQVTSRSICTYWEKSSSLYPRLLYIYHTQPLAFGNKDNMQQFGGGMLSIKDQNTLTIHYWTTSLTRGKIELKKVV